MWRLQFTLFFALLHLTTPAYLSLNLYSQALTIPRHRRAVESNAYSFSIASRNVRLTTGLSLKGYEGTAKEVAIYQGKVIRVAAKKFELDGSKPSSKYYTTRKKARERLFVSKDGVIDDYNHYRTTALKSSGDRALSILTYDVMNLLRAHQYPVEDGDLGENILVDGVTFDFFEPGRRYQFGEENGVVAEIVEHMMPCANLCKLPYINDERMEPVERIEKCKALLNILNQDVGLRGWYARVVQEGSIAARSAVVRLK